jgi:hypothetical protein
MPALGAGRRQRDRPLEVPRRLIELAEPEMQLAQRRRQEMVRLHHGVVGELPEGLEPGGRTA